MHKENNLGVWTCRVTGTRKCSLKLFHFILVEGEFVLVVTVGERILRFTLFDILLQFVFARFVQLLPLAIVNVFAIDAVLLAVSAVQL